MTIPNEVSFADVSGVQALIKAASTFVGGQNELARRIQRPRSVVSAWAVGSRRPSAIEEARIAAYAKKADADLVSRYIDYLRKVTDGYIQVIAAETREWEPESYREKERELRARIETAKKRRSRKNSGKTKQPIAKKGKKDGVQVQG